MSAAAHRIPMAGGGTALALSTPPTADGAALLRDLGLPSPRGSLIVNGSTAPSALLHSPRVDDLADVLDRGLARVAVDDGLTVVTGATDAGVFSMLGDAMVHATAPLIGVAPLGLVTWPGRDDGAEREALEPHHSHFVLVEGDAWGDETGTMLAFADALGRLAPSAAVLCGGGAGARLELLGHVRAGRPVVVLAGSGRLADDLAAARGGSSAGDPSLEEVVEEGDLLVCRLSDGADALAGTVRALMVLRR